MIEIEIAIADPAQAGLGEVDLNPRARCNRPPAVAAGGMEIETGFGQRRGVNTDRAAQPRRQWIGDLVDFDCQRCAIPYDLARADPEVAFVPRDRAVTAFGHGPAFAVAIERDIERAMVERIGAAAPTGEGVVGREHAADKGNQRNAVASVIAQRVDIPPGIAVVRDRAVESRSSITLAAAIRPDSAAIGTPGPGCALPPAR